MSHKVIKRCKKITKHGHARQSEFDSGKFLSKIK